MILTNKAMAAILENGGFKSKVLFVVCLVDCETPVGLEDGRINDNQISASSHWNEHVASNARLNNKMHIKSNGQVVWGGWCTDKKNPHQYLEVLQIKYCNTEARIQGR